MTLFFETSHQANTFLLSVPLGFMLALTLDTGPKSGGMRFAMDLLALLSTGLNLLLLLFCFQEEKLRLYHILGLVIGAVLYIHSIGHLVRAVKEKLKSQRKRGRISPSHGEVDTTDT